MTYIEILIMHILEMHSLQGKYRIQSDTNNFIFLPLTCDIKCYATPDQDIEDTLSIEFKDQSGKLLDWITIKHEWSGCISEDIRSWKNHVDVEINKFISKNTVSKIPFLQGGARA